MSSLTQHYQVECPPDVYTVFQGKYDVVWKVTTSQISECMVSVTIKHLA